MKILGLDLGISSIGWALIEVGDATETKILGMGSRILPFGENEINDFNKGKGETPCQARTLARSARRNLFRYKMRRKLLSHYLLSLGMLPDRKLMNELSPLELWELRAKAATKGEKISLVQLGRILLHLNRKRGYRHSRVGDGEEKETEYVEKINQRYRDLKFSGLTVGQEFFHRLKESECHLANGAKIVNARLKEKVYPRQAYLDEFNSIVENQRKYYPEILNDESIANLEYAIFHQRPLKSCKHLVSLCEFSAREYTTQEGRKVIAGPKVAPRTSPLSQICRLYEAVNNIRLINFSNKKDSSAYTLFDSELSNRERRLRNREYVLTKEEKRRVVEYLNSNKVLSSKALLKILGLSTKDGFVPDRNVLRGIKGNDTYIKIKEALGDYPVSPELLRFNIPIVEKVNHSTGELLQVVSSDIIKDPFYRLWHLLYSVSDPEELKKSLRLKFQIEDEDVLNRLCEIDFTTPGYTNKSTKMIREILPYLMDGYDYSTSCALVGIDHSNSITKEDNLNRELKSQITPLKQNSLRQPMVEKVVNQMINLVNALIERFGPIDEVRIELARSLKSSSSERDRITNEIRKREKENEKYSKLISEQGIEPTRKRIQKYRMWEENDKRCMYCNQPVNLSEWLMGIDAEVEHIIPRSLFFDDSFSNKTCACRKCNHDKGQETGYDFMASRGERVLDEYVARVENLYGSKKISKAKRNRLLTSKPDIPTDFLERDMRITQYISKKACEVLREAIRDVWVSSGTVTAYLRHIWGYDEIIHNLNLEKYRKADLVREVEYECKGQIHTRSVIVDWSKRMDHRHHAVDALTIALTRQGYIQKLSTLNASHTAMFKELMQNGGVKKGESLLMQWAKTLPHFPVHEVEKEVEKIAISRKNSNKLTTPGKRKFRRNGKTMVVQENLNVPRGPLHQETIYGKILIPDGEKKIAYAFEFPHLIVNPLIRDKVEKILKEFGGDWKSAHKSLNKKNPFLHPKTHEAIDRVACYKEEFIGKKKLTSLEIKNIHKVVDGKIRSLLEDRTAKYSNDKAFQASFNEDPLRLHIWQAPIRSVKITTGYKAESMVASRKDREKTTIGYSPTGSNHHVAFYETDDGKIVNLQVSFWAAVMRKNHGLPVVITDPKQAVDALMEVMDDTIREELARTLPSPDWKFLSKYRINDTYILGMSDADFEMALRDGDQSLLVRHLYRVQKVSGTDITFRLHTDTTTDNSAISSSLCNHIRVCSYSALKELNPKEIKVDIIGKIYLP